MISRLTTVYHAVSAPLLPAGSIALATVLPIAPAVAGGLYIQEFATPSMSVAGAGAQAVADDASTAFHNPAGMPRLEGHQLLNGAGVIISDTKFDAERRAYRRTSRERI